MLQKVVYAVTNVLTNSEIFMLWHVVHTGTNKGLIYFPHVQVLTHQSISKIF